MGGNVSCTNLKIFGNDMLQINLPQVVQASITWKQCKVVPIALDDGKTTVINGKVYCGGGDTDKDDDYYIVYCYDPSQDNWTTLPPLPVMWFDLGQVNGKLVAVGGLKESDDSDSTDSTNEVYTYDERSKKWKQTIPLMPTARHSPGVLSLQSALVVAGGHPYTDAVEIFKADTSQWYTTDPLPTACYDISLVAIGNTCYALGGYRSPSRLNQAFYASVDDLLHNAVPANQTTHSGRTFTQSAWKTLPDTPTFEPAAAVLAGRLLAVGGKETSTLGGAAVKEVYTYSPSANSWIYISDLPAPRCNAAVAVLSPSEILMIGGYYGGTINTVYKGTLHLKL